MLSHFVSVYVPGTHGLNGLLPKEEQTRIAQETARRLSAAFGGATAYPAIGYYVSDSGILVEESCIIVKSYHDADPAAALQTARSIGQWIKDTLSQEAVSIESEAGLEFI